MKVRQRPVAPTDSLRPQLGDILQRLAFIAPHDLYAIALIAKDALIRAEKEHDLSRRRGARG